MADQKLIIDFWDVGQGDGTVIRLPDGSVILIDVGPKGSPIIDWLSDRKCPLKAVVITHNDEDHAGSLPSLVKIPGISIGRVYMLLDRDKKSRQFLNIWEPVHDEEVRGRLSVRVLSIDSIIWQSGDDSLRVLYPSFSENIEAKEPNETSAIVCYLHKDEVKIIWPGDAPMKIVAEKCAGTRPFLLHGPHHGAPVDRKSKGFDGWVQALTPERTFISVGTNNQYNIPSPDYLSLLTNHGCRVTCTELTKHCDNNLKPVLDGALLLGLRASRRGVPCRGCFRLNVLNGQVLPDAWDAEHFKRVRNLRRAKCIEKTRRSGTASTGIPSYTI